MTRKEQLAYTAGLIDGEGYISILPSTASKVSYVPIVKVASCDKFMTPYLLKHYGGHVTKRTATKANTNDSTCWALTNTKVVENFLIDILPYLRVKKANALNVISYAQNCKLKKIFNKQTNTYTIYPELLALRRQHYEKAKKLNRRGLALAETK